MIIPKHILSNRVLEMEESQTLAMSKLSRKLSSEGKNIINLSIGEPDFATPKHICKAAKQAIDDGITHYTPVSGLPSLKKAIQDKLLRDNNLTYDLNQIQVSVGAKQAIANIILSIINPGDEVLLIAPYWVSYHAIIKLAGGIPVILETTVENNFKTNRTELQEKVTNKTKLLLFSSPCNPSGSVYQHEEMKALSLFLEDNPKILAISDEIYELISFGNTHYSLAQFPNTKDRVILVNGVSKGFSMTGWRIGYAVGPQWLMASCEKIQGQFTSGACSISQKAAEAALSQDYTPSYDMCRIFEERRNLMYEGLSRIQGLKVNLPEGAFFLFPNISRFFGKKYKDYTINTSEDLVYYLLYEANVACVDGAAFGNKNCIRMSYANDTEVLKLAISNITKVLNQLS